MGGKIFFPHTFSVTGIDYFLYDNQFLVYLLLIKRGGCNPPLPVEMVLTGGQTNIRCFFFMIFPVRFFSVILHYQCRRSYYFCFIRQFRYFYFCTVCQFGNTMLIQCLLYRRLP